MLVDDTHVLGVPCEAGSWTQIPMNERHSTATSHAALTRLILLALPSILPPPGRMWWATSDTGNHNNITPHGRSTTTRQPAPCPHTILPHDPTAPSAAGHPHPAPAAGSGVLVSASLWLEALGHTNTNTRASRSERLACSPLQAPRECPGSHQFLATQNPPSATPLTNPAEVLARYLSLGSSSSHHGSVAACSDAPCGPCAACAMHTGSMAVAWAATIEEDATWGPAAMCTHEDSLLLCAGTVDTSAYEVLSDDSCLQWDGEGGKWGDACSHCSGSCHSEQHSSYGELQEGGGDFSMQRGGNGTGDPPMVLPAVAAAASYHGHSTPHEEPCSPLSADESVLHVDVGPLPLAAPAADGGSDAGPGACTPCSPAVQAHVQAGGIRAGSREVTEDKLAAAALPRRASNPWWRMCWCPA